MKKEWERKLLPFNEEKITSLLKKVRVVYADVDATLLGPGGSLFSSPEGGYTLRPAQAILACLKKGVDITLVSGRNARQLFGDARILGLKNYLAELGCEIVYNLGEKSFFTVKDLPFKGNTPHEAIEHSGAVGALLSHFSGRLEHHTPWSEGRRCTFVFRGFIDVQEANTFLEKEGYTFLEVIDNGRIKTKGSLSSDLPEVHAYHLLPKGATKARGVRKDREIREVGKEECVGVGDAPSDLQIAPEVGVFFLLKNGVEAHPELEEEVAKRENVFVTQKRMGEGFAEVISFLSLKGLL
jgi:hypothetical protein